MNSRLPVLAASLALLPILVAAKETFNGQEIPPTPPGCIDRGSILLGPSASFGVTHLECNGREIILLEKFVEYRGKKAYWKVIDEMRIPEHSPQNVVLSIGFCTSEGYPDDPILAFGQWKKAEDGSFIAKNISHSWRFNLAQGKIEAIPTRGISCSAEDPDPD